MPTLAAIVKEIDKRAGSRPIGHLQELRKDLKGLVRLPGRTIFSSQTTFEHYAFHFGGRKELQFNVGFDSSNAEKMFRHGVAFSLEPSQTLPDIEVLVPKIQRFNEFIRRYPHEFTGLLMWHYDEKGRSSNYPPTTIPAALFRPDVFIFLGRLQKPDDIDYERILDDFDQLLPLYRFVEGKSGYPSVAKTEGKFQFKPGCTVKATTTKAAVVEKQLDVNLHHNDIQYALYEHLVSLYGTNAVGTEVPSGTGGKVDVVVRHGNKYWFYEIKTALSARGCILDGLAQLLEYSFWHGAQEAQRLVIVGEPASDEESKAFIDLLRKRFSLPVMYKQFDLKKGKLLNFED
jgi:hypothetical protein